MILTLEEKIMNQFSDRLKELTSAYDTASLAEISGIRRAKREVAYIREQVKQILIKYNEED